MMIFLVNQNGGQEDKQLDNSYSVVVSRVSRLLHACIWQKPQPLFPVIVLDS